MTLNTHSRDVSGELARNAARVLPHDLGVEPALAYPELFARMARCDAHIDFKAFADATPRAEPDAIRAHWLAERNRTDEELLSFLDNWFEFPDSAPAKVAAVASGLTLRDHIAALWPQLTRKAAAPARGSSLLPLPNRYLVPGGMFRESYYWDCYFTLVGLSEEHAALRQECVDNATYLIDRFGFVPNGGRTYYLSRSQPPMYFAMVALLDQAHPARAFARYLPQLVKEHGFWMKGEAGVSPGQASRSVVVMPDGSRLNRYWDEGKNPRTECFGRDLALGARWPERRLEELYREIRAACATGWDFSSRWFEDGRSMSSIDTTSIIPVDLNSLLYGLERAIEAGARESGQSALEREFCLQADSRRRAMNAYLWNDRANIFDDYNWRRGALRQAITPASFFPLFVNLASTDQAERTASAMDSLLWAGGLVTSLTESGEQWDAPNGWAPLQWVAIEGLRSYGHVALAKEIANRWVTMVSRVYRETGTLFEKYDVARMAPGGGGEYPLQDGFGWTNGVTAALLDHHPDLASLSETVVQAATGRCRPLTPSL